MNELQENGITHINLDDESSLKDEYEKLDYLNYVVKETLRIDPPVAYTPIYHANQNVNIWGVQFDKDTDFVVNTLLPHLNPEEWREPEKFIPERFDSESEYYFKPGSLNETRDPRSYIPFSLGIRNCAGQALGKLEFKVVLSRLLTVLDIEVSSEQLNNNFCRFGMMSQMHLNCKITNKNLLSH